MSKFELLLSGFADEVVESKSLDIQFSTFAALGLKYLSIRFVEVGNVVKNIVDLNASELDIVLQKLDDYKLRVSSIGSPIGKTRLIDFEDGTGNSFFEFDRYLQNQVKRTCEIARKLDSKLIRGFSFYHPKGTDPMDYIAESSQRIAAISELCESEGLTFGLEVEANLIGQNAATLNAIYETVDSDALVLIFDGANLVTQGYSTAEIVNQFRAMSHAIGWIHVKDYRSVLTLEKNNYVDENSLASFVPAGNGDGGYPEVLSSLKSSFVAIETRMKARGVEGVFADLEPHLKGGGQFGGFSGPDGFGIAVRKFCSLCDDAGFIYQLRDFGSTCS